MPEGMTGGLLGNPRLNAVLHHEFAYPPLGNRLPLVIEKYPVCITVRSYPQIAFQGMDAFFLQSDLPFHTPLSPNGYRGLDKINIPRAAVRQLRYPAIPLS